jgi:hypothetical protein
VSFLTASIVRPRFEERSVATSFFILAVVERIRRSGSSIGIADPIQLSGKAGARVRHTLEGLAGVTGGKVFYPSKNGMDEVFEQIALELRHHIQ